MLTFLLSAFLVSNQLFLSEAVCNGAEVSAVSSFSTRDATIVNHVAILGEFTLKCSNNESPQLFAVLGDKIYLVARVATNTFQLSWSEDTKTARSNQYNFKLYDEIGFSEIRKAQRAKEDISEIKPLIEVAINHPGSYKGPWINSELVATFASIVVSYFALVTKSKLLS